MSAGGSMHDDDPWLRLIAASEALAFARTMDAVVATLRDTARAVCGADGIAVVLRDGLSCFYAAEDARVPLWTGQRFSSDFCVSGWAMNHRETVVIPDIRIDPRVPQA